MEPVRSRPASPGQSVATTVVLLAALQVPAIGEAQKLEDLAETPPMGWNSWNGFHCDIDERLVRETAEAMVASGMKEAGYEYVNIDYCWHGERDEQGFIHPDPERFPSGMKAELGTTRKALAAEVPPHDVLMVRLVRLPGEGGRNGGPD